MTVPALPGIPAALRRLTVLCCMALGICLGLEGGVRLLMPRFDPAGQVRFVRQASGLVLGVPGFQGRQWKNTGDYDVEVRINRHGFRDRNGLASPDPGAVFVAGDSFAFGWGVEEDERFSNLLAAALEMPVRNIAVPGTDLDDAARLVLYARSRGARIHVLVLAVCMENDLRPYRPGPARPPPSPRGRWPALSLSGLKAWLSGHSALYGAVTTVVHGNTWLRGLLVRAGLVRENLASLGGASYHAGIIAASAAKAREVLELSGADQGLVLIVPSRALWTGTRRAEARRVHRAFVHALEERGIPVADPAPDFEASGRPLSFHFARDGHWNPAGHALAAACLERLCRRLGMGAAPRSGDGPVSAAAPPASGRE